MSAITALVSVGSVAKAAQQMYQSHTIIVSEIYLTLLFVNITTLLLAKMSDYAVGSHISYEKWQPLGQFLENYKQIIDQMFLK